MEIYDGINEIPGPFPGAVVTIGNCDGVHLGHQILFSEVVSRAYRSQGTSVALTFEPHPLKVMRPEIGLKLISTPEQKKELIALANIDKLIILPFTKEFAATPAEVFVDQVLRRAIGVRDLIVGYDYAFGKGRQGDIAFLKEQGQSKGFSVSVVEPFFVDGMLASSSKIRELVGLGKMRYVRKLLGRYYQIRGEVVMGKQRGGPLLGFPTANLALSEEDLCPRLGVYVCQVIYDGKCYGGVMNIGYNPTFAGSQLCAETHIFDYNQDIYGKPIKINLLRFIRSEIKFADHAELAKQIAMDVAEAKQVLAEAENELTLSCEEKFNR